MNSNRSLQPCTLIQASSSACVRSVVTFLSNGTSGGESSVVGLIHDSRRASRGSYLGSGPSDSGWLGLAIFSGVGVELSWHDSLLEPRGRRLNRARYTSRARL